MDRGSYRNDNGFRLFDSGVIATTKGCEAKCASGDGFFSLIRAGPTGGSEVQRSSTCNESYALTFSARCVGRSLVLLATHRTICPYSSSSFLRMAGTDLADVFPNSVTTTEINLSLVVSNNSRKASSVLLSGSISL